MRVNLAWIGRATLIAVLFVSASAYAHHGMSSFDTTRPITLNGTIRSIEWVNPHVIIHLDVKDARGKVETWVVQSGAPNIMVRRGMPRDTLQPGVLLTATGYPPRAGVSQVGMASGAEFIGAGRMVYSYEVKFSD
jgi:hypothetical protein